MLLLLLAARRVYFLIEQPASSMLAHHPSYCYLKKILEPCGFPMSEAYYQVHEPQN